MKYMIGVLSAALILAGCGDSGGGGGNVNGNDGGVGDDGTGPRILTGLTVSGPDVVAEGSQAQYTATASYDDGSSRDVTLSATWSVDGPGSIGTDGLYTAPDPLGAVTAVTVRASYTEDTVTEQGELAVTLTTQDTDTIEGYGYQTAGGEGGEVYHVTSLDDSGPGTLREGVTGRDYQADGPRIIVFDVAGEITLQSDVVVREPYLTIDGETAPSPGITIRKTTISDGEFIIAGTHDIIVRHLRFHGLWEMGGAHANNAATISIDGDTGPDHIARNIVLDHITARNATDGGPDIWGEVSDVTVQWCFFFYNWHPTTVSHYPSPFQVRQRITMHHNVYAKNEERNPQIRADVRDFDYVNNVLYDWGYFGEGGGYGIRIKNDPGEPQVNGNFVNNAFIPTIRPGWALVYGIDPGADANDGGPASPPDQGTVVLTSSMGNLWVSGNLLPAENQDHYSTVDQPLAVPAPAQVTTYPAAELGARVLPFVGMIYRDGEEQTILDEIASNL